MFQPRQAMQLRWLTIVLACALSGCGRDTKPNAQPAEAEPLARTEFTERIENFFEYEPLKAGQPSQFLIHLSDLTDGSPVEKADVTLTIRPQSGIYVADVNLANAGAYDIEFHVKNNKLDERMPLADFKVE